MLRYIFLSLIFISTNGISNGIGLNTAAFEQSPNSQFNPDGYYFPKESIEVKDFSFGWLAILSEPVNSHSITLRLVKPNGKWVEIHPYRYKLQRDSSFFYFQHQNIGDVIIEGRFTGNKGPTDDNIKVKETVVFKGKIIVAGKVSPLEMTWWQGD